MALVIPTVIPRSLKLPVGFDPSTFTYKLTPSSSPNLSHLQNNKIRFIVDDVIKFLEREKRRGRTYHGVIMDPPSYGRGPNGEVWRLEDNLKELLFKVKDIMDKDFDFILINSYTTGVSPTSLNNILKLTFEGSRVETGEIALPIEENNLVLPCGIYGKVTRD